MINYAYLLIPITVFGVVALLGSEWFYQLVKQIKKNRN